MQEIRLRKSPRNPRFLILPSDDILECGALAFHLKSEKLIDPLRFNDVAHYDYGWPRLSVENHEQRITSALVECDFRTETLSVYQRGGMGLAILDLLEYKISLEECFDKLARIAT